MKSTYGLIALVFAVFAIFLASMFLTHREYTGNGNSVISRSKKPASVLDECYKIIGDKPRTELAACLTGKLTKEDDRLTAINELIRGNYAQIDSASTDTAIKSLVTSEKSFVQFRHDECKRIGDGALGGSGAGDFQLACEVDLTRWRIDWLTRHQ